MIRVGLWLMECYTCESIVWGAEFDVSFICFFFAFDCFNEYSSKSYTFVRIEM